MSKQELFLGAWTLKAWTVTKPDQSVRHPYGEDPKGFIIYTPQGVMSATLMKQERPRVETARPKMTAKFAESLQLMRTEDKFNPFSSAYFLSAVQYMNYCGRYTIGDGTVTHHVETALIADWVGIDLIRTFAFDGDTLTLSAREDGLLDKLVWQRVPGQYTDPTAQN